MDIKSKYTLVERRVLSNNKSITQYENNLYYRIQYLNNVLLSQNIFSLLLHPVKLYRTKIAVKKYNDYYKEFNKLKDEKIEDITSNVSSDIETNYCYAVVHLKPEKLENFIINHQLESDKKLLKIRK